MEIRSPLSITPRLLPGCEIGGAWISIEYAYITLDGRQCYCWYIDRSGDNEENFHSYDLHSGVSGGTLQEGLENLLVFLGAFAEAHVSEGRIGGDVENLMLFPADLINWAVQNIDAITTMELELIEHPGELIVE